MQGKLPIITIEEILLSKCGQVFGTYFGYSVIFEKNNKCSKFCDQMTKKLFLAKMQLPEQ